MVETRWWQCRKWMLCADPTTIKIFDLESCAD